MTRECALRLAQTARTHLNTAKILLQFILDDTHVSDLSDQPNPEPVTPGEWFELEKTIEALKWIELPGEAPV